MRKLAWVLCLVLLLTGVTFAQASEEIAEEMELMTWTLDEEETTLTITLASNATTGFLWTVEIEPEGIVEAAEGEYLPDEPAEEEGLMVGVGGKTVFVINPAMTEEGIGGAVTLMFSYAQPWEEDVDPAIMIAMDLWVVEDGTLQVEDVFQILPEEE